MPYSLTVDYPNMPKGQELSIVGLGTFKNGSTTTISDEEAQMFRDMQVANNMEDRTLLAAFKDSDYVTVEVAKTEKKDDDKKKEGDN